MYHSRIVLSVGGSVWYMIRNLRCTVTIDSVLANSKTQNAFLFTANAIFRHDYPLAVEPASTPRPLVRTKKNLERFSTCVLICSFLPCLSWLLQLVSSNFTTNTDDVKIKFHTYFSLCLSCSHHISLFLYSSTSTTYVQQCYNVWTTSGITLGQG